MCLHTDDEVRVNGEQGTVEVLQAEDAMLAGGQLMAASLGVRLIGLD